MQKEKYLGLKKKKIKVYNCIEYYWGVTTVHIKTIYKNDPTIL